MQALEALNILVKKYRMKDLKLKFIGGIGDMEYYNSLLQYCSNNNLNNNVVFEDFSLDLREERKRHGIALVCSIYEAMGRVTPEAMLANQLVIGANFGGTKEIIENKYNGYLYELNNPDDLADKIYNAIKNEKVSSEIIDNAYKYAKKNFDNNIQNEKVVCIYNKIMKERVTKKNE